MQTDRSGQLTLLQAVQVQLPSGFGLVVALAGGSFLSAVAVAVVVATELAAGTSAVTESVAAVVERSSVPWGEREHMDAHETLIPLAGASRTCDACALH